MFLSMSAVKLSLSAGLVETESSVEFALTADTDKKN